MAKYSSGNWQVKKISEVLAKKKKKKKISKGTGGERIGFEGTRIARISFFFIAF